MDYIGEGTGYYISQGKAVKITWSKASETEKTIYKLENGETLTLNAGKTWICVFPPEQENGVVIE
jgi:hypothetical protein